MSFRSISEEYEPTLIPCSYRDTWFRVSNTARICDMHPIHTSRWTRKISLLIKKIMTVLEKTKPGQLQTVTLTKTLTHLKQQKQSIVKHCLSEGIWIIIYFFLKSTWSFGADIRVLTIWILPSFTNNIPPHH